MLNDTLSRPAQRLVEMLAACPDEPRTVTLSIPTENHAAALGIDYRAFERWRQERLANIARAVAELEAEGVPLVVEHRTGREVGDPALDRLFIISVGA